MSHPEALAFAPATVANVAVGFDVLGHAFAGLGDRVRARPIAGDAVVVAAITGTDADRLPRDPEQNTAAAAVRSLLAEVRPDFGIELRIEKGIPLSSGLGGSAASAVAGVVAANALLPEPHPRAELYPHALAGEMVASGAAHGDNVGPALVGGLVLALADRVRSLPVPEGLWCAVACPDMALETRAARAALLAPYAIEEFVAQQRNFAVVLAGLFTADFESLRAGLADVIVEPRRAPMIPGFAAVKRAALEAGALGASISGGGPSVFAWFQGEGPARRGVEPMVEAFAGAGLRARGHVAPVGSPGARIEEIE